MGRYAVRRMLQFIPVFFGATFLIFALVFAMPGDPVRALSGERPLPNRCGYEIRDSSTTSTDPLLVQYGKYMATGPARSGDFGDRLPRP